MFKITRLADCPNEAMPNDRGFVIRLVGEHTDARNVDVHINVLRPGGPDGHYHFHERAENVYWILSGRGRLVVEGQEHEVKQDDVVFMPPGTRHSLAIVGDEELRLLEIYAPAGKDFHVVE